MNAQVASRFASLLVLVLLSCSLLGAGEPDRDELRIRLRNALWQTLPDSIESVFVGPGEKLWFVQRPSGEEPALDDVKKRIKREFPRESPVLLGCLPALFETDGRVWFTARSGTVLLGYDGARFEEHRLPEGRRVLGRCPNHGGSHRGRANVFSGGVPFFTITGGVLAFVESRWIEHPSPLIPLGEGGSRSAPELVAWPDGKGALALIRGLEHPGLWLWKGREWKPVDLPKFLLSRVEAAVPDPGGLWLFTDTRLIRHDLGKDTAEVFRRHLEKLGSRSFLEREKASESLKQMGPLILAFAESALQETRDLEVRIRLREIISSLESEEQMEVAIGQYRLVRPRLTRYGNDGFLYLSSEKIRIRDVDIGQGILVSDGKGTVRAFTGFDMEGILDETRGRDAWGVLSVVPGKRIWVPGRTLAGGARLVEVGHNRILAEIPGRDLTSLWIQAVKADGTAFFRSENGSITVFTPGAPDDRNVLEAETVEIVDANRFGVGTDGHVWAVWPEKGLHRFDGKAWRKVLLPEPAGEVKRIVPGAEGSVLVVAQFKTVLFGEEPVHRKSLHELVRDARKDVRRYFAGGAYSRGFDLASDRAGNVWLREGWDLRVLVEDKWIPAEKALRGAGSRNGKAEFMRLCGDGSAVYVADLRGSKDPGRSFLGCVRGGGPAFRWAPNSSNSLICHPVRDSGGVLWIPGTGRTHAEAGGPDDIQLAYRISDEGAVAKLENKGWAKLSDRSGNVWLGSISSRPADLFHVWRNGRIEQTLTVPGAHKNSGLVSDRAGSVFVRTRLGIQHLEARDPDRPARYTLGKRFSIEGMNSTILHFEHSCLGYFVLVTWTSCPWKYRLHLVPVPRGE